MTENTDFSTSQCLTTAVVPDLVALKGRQQAMWASGDFAVIGTTLQFVGESLCEAVDIQAGSQVLDVACGNGNAALAAARRFCRVTGLDYVPGLLARARERAAGERLPIDFVQGDAEALPFPDAAFDVALSTYGVMFAPHQERAARELMRVVRPGGRIALANWTPDGFIGGLLVAVGRHVPPPAGVASPIYWGVEARLRELFPGVSKLTARRNHFVFRYESPEHFLARFRRFYGPTYQAFAALDPNRQARLAADILELIARYRSPGRSQAVAIPAEYLEVVIDR